jgi:hypothetical protein
MVNITKSAAYMDCYNPDPLVDKNVFRAMTPEDADLPAFEKVRALLPVPRWDGHTESVDAYWRAMELAFGNLRRPTPANGFVANYIDTAFNGNLFMWDSSFILMFGRYAARAFGFQRTLDNFYAKQHPDGFISREIHEENGQGRFHRFDPVSTGPNIMPWCEWDYFLNAGDRERLGNVFGPLLAYYRWTRRQRTWPDGSYWSSGWGCGMDNQPRLPAGCHHAFDHGHMAWIDACCQAVFAARTLRRMADALGCAGDVKDLDEEADRLSAFINEKMWNEKTRIYSDRWADGSVTDVKSIGAYWALIAGVAPPDRRDALIAHLRDPAVFNRPHRVPTLSADHPEYKPLGGYWRGAVWPPTNYMVLRGLTASGLDDLAYEIGRNHHDRVMDVFKTTGTFWENYAPESAAPGKPAKKDFVGWSGLGPISVFFEYVLGLRPDVPAGALTWDVRLTEAHGVTNYPWGVDGRVDLFCPARKSAKEKPKVEVKSAVPLKVLVKWEGGSETAFGRL